MRLEPPPDNCHPGQEPVVEDRRGRQPSVDRLPNQSPDVIVQSEFEIVGYPSKQIHATSLLVQTGPVTRAMRARHSKVSHPEQHE